jgi:hypothetical protein
MSPDFEWIFRYEIIKNISFNAKPPKYAPLYGDFRKYMHILNTQKEIDAIIEV